MMKLKKYFLIYMYYSRFDAFSVNLNFIDVNFKKYRLCSVPVY